MTKAVGSVCEWEVGGGREGGNDVCCVEMGIVCRVRKGAGRVLGLCVGVHA